MKTNLTILFLIFSSMAEGQVDSLFPNRVNNLNDESYYRRLLQNSNDKNIDSTNEAIKLIFDLHNFNSKKYNSALLQPLLNKIERFQQRFFKETIIGKWRSESLGSDWENTIEKMINPNKQFVSTDNEAFFFKSDSVIRRTSYFIITRPIKVNLLTFNRFSIQFLDTKDEWSFYFITKGHGVPFHGNAQKLYLLFNKHPNCVCGCPEELYSVEQNSQQFFGSVSSNR